jgi:hypothetical protein
LGSLDAGYRDDFFGVLEFSEPADPTRFWKIWEYKYDHIFAMEIWSVDALGDVGRWCEYSEVSRYHQCPAFCRPAIRDPYQEEMTLRLACVFGTHGFNESPDVVRGNIVHEVRHLCDYASRKTVKRFQNWCDVRCPGEGIKAEGTFVFDFEHECECDDRDLSCERCERVTGLLYEFMEERADLAEREFNDKMRD